MAKKKSYIVQDVQRAGFTLEPMRCVHCGKVGETQYHQYISDAYCSLCGKWQLSDKKNGSKKKLRKLM